MRSLALLGKRLALAHAEAVLLVGDDQPQPGKLDPFAEDRVGADQEIDLARGELLQNFPARGGVG